MSLSRIKLSVRGLLLVIALLAIPLSWAADRTGQRRDWCIELADRHARMAAAYRRNAPKIAEGAATESMHHLADWNDYMSRCYLEAAAEVWGPIPKSSPVPPAGWTPASAP